MCNVSKRKKDGSRAKIKSVGDHKEFLKRITKTLYYGQLPALPCLSLPVTEISCELWSVSQRGRSLRRLHGDTAAAIARSACVSPCALVLAILYLERLNSCNPEYLTSTAPADLFLVSLMVSNKFLQDDGEDDEVFCSEWAASGGIELNQLKKLEVEFLNAIDWNIYVSEKSFEERLHWLEKQVALKQAQLRGFFTYTDLAATCDTIYIRELIKSVSSMCIAVAVSYIAGLMTFVTSALVIYHTWAPATQYVLSRDIATTSIATIDTSDMPTYETPYNINTTLNLELAVIDAAYENLILSEKVKCCNKWQRYIKDIKNKKKMDDNIVNYQIKIDEWWSQTSVLNWLYQSALINPMQRWLERINEYVDLYKHKISFTSNVRYDDKRCEQVHRGSKQLCISQWLNLSKLSALVISVSDH